MAAATAAPTALAPPSPAPFNPSGLSGLGASSRDQHIDRRHFARGRHQIIGESHRQRLAALVVEELFEQRAADALREAADDLPLDQHRIDGPADIVGDEIALDRRRRRCRDRCARPQCARRRDSSCGRCGTIPRPKARGARAAQASSRAQARCAISPRVTEGPGRGVVAHHLAVDDVERVGRRAAAVRRRPRSPWRAPRARRSRVASPVMTVTREANAPMPNSMRSVWPWMTRTRAIVDAERIGADLRDHGLDALGPPRPRRRPPRPRRRCRRDRAPVERAEPALLHEQRNAGADEFAGGARRSTSRLQARPIRPPPAPCRAARHSRRNRARPRCRACRAAARRAFRRRRSDCAAAPRSRSRPSRAAIASISRSRTKVLSKRPGAR